MRRFAFLRAINVGGHRVSMDDLRRIFADLGVADAETFLASGNLIFDRAVDRREDAAALERRLEAGLEQALGYEVATFVRDADELAGVVDAVPDETRRLESVEAVNLAFLRSSLDELARIDLDGLETDIDEFHLEGRHLFWLCGTRQSESTFSNKVFERTVGRECTFRGLNTLRRLVRKYL